MSRFVGLAMLMMLCGSTWAEDGGRVVVRKVPPEMPALAKQLNLYGTVKLDVTVEPSGKVAEVKGIGGNPILMNAAVSAVKQWQYAPGTSRDNVMVAVEFHR